MSVRTAARAREPAAVRPGIFSSAPSSAVSIGMALEMNVRVLAGVVGLIEPICAFALTIQTRQTAFACVAQEPDAAPAAPAPARARATARAARIRTIRT